MNNQNKNSHVYLTTKELQQEEKLKVEPLELIKVSYTRPGPSPQVTECLPSPKIDSVDIAYAYLESHFNKDTIDIHEEAYMILLTNSLIPLGIYKLGTGDHNKVIISFRTVAQVALLTAASGVIIAHNHPSGNLKPSDSDIHVMRNIAKALDLFEIKLLDTLIITSGGNFTSFIEKI